MTLPNLITIGRLILVPLVVWLIASNMTAWAFIAFVIAGISDGVDGFIAKRFDLSSELGAYLDPIADKALLVSIFVALGLQEEIPIWLVIMVVSRDLLIVGAFILSYLLDQPMTPKPLWVSKGNTVFQILLAATVLADLGFDIGMTVIRMVLVSIVAALTAMSAAAYLVGWIRHMGGITTDGEKHQG
ncbi:MAG: CDP-alcohol phosphatidyltransferase family protein [Hyphomicrobiales bacterium]|nr:CDP-alcohol phosphatidyltransferase family protein [Hyphomicrobiales bacterium]